MVAALDRKLFQEAKRYIPGGVNSPVRSFQAVGGYPIFIKQGKGSKIYSECGKEFIDYCMSWGVLILGHAHPEVTTALLETIKKGTSFGTATRLEIELAKLIVEALPSIEQVRLTNSGTEAIMSAIRLARAYTGKDKIIKFQGAYHGHADYLLDCPGSPQDFTRHTLVAEYNDIGKVRKLVEQNKKDLAAIIVEPVAANMGVVLPKDGFLPELRRLSHSYGILLIFDEVITGFRFIFGGIQKLFAVEPDLTCLGKIIGGGLPIGAFGARQEIMRLLAPQGKVYQAGTFSGNPLTVTAGITTLKILKRENPYAALAEKTRQLCQEIGEQAREFQLKLKINYIGSVFSIFFSVKEVWNYTSARLQNAGLFNKFFHGLLKQGIYFSPSGFEANFLSTAHCQEDLRKTTKAIGILLKNLRR